MGLLINGVWQEHEPETTKDGHFERRDSAFRNWITPEGGPAPPGRMASARWRALSSVCLARLSLGAPDADHAGAEGMQDIIPISVTHWLMAEHGWTFAAGEGVVPDPLYNSRYLYELYARADDSIPAARRCRSCGISTPRPSSTTNQPISSGCSVRHLIRSAPSRVIIIRSRYALKSTRQPADLRHAEQRCLQGRLRHDPSRLRGGRQAAVRNTGLAGGPSVPITLSVRRSVDRG